MCNRGEGAGVTGSHLNLRQSSCSILSVLSYAVGLYKKLSKPCEC